MPQPSGITLNRDDFESEAEYKKEYYRQYDALNRRKERNRELYQLNIEDRRKKAREYRQKNPEMFKKLNEERNKRYYEDKEKQRRAIERGWGKSGIKFFEDTFDKYYEATHCEVCNCEFIKGRGQGKNKKCLDHDHFSGYPRHIVCISCNVWRRGYDTRRAVVHLELYRKSLLK